MQRVRLHQIDRRTCFVVLEADLARLCMLHYTQPPTPKWLSHITPFSGTVSGCGSAGRHSVDMAHPDRVQRRHVEPTCAATGEPS